MKWILAVFSAVLFFTSCTVEQHFSFNKNYSGNYTFTMNYQAIQEMPAEEGEEVPEEEKFNLSDSLDLDEFVKEINALKGISNAKVTDEDGVFKIYYEFKDVESLNNSLEELNMEEHVDEGHSKERPTFVAKGNKFDYHFHKIDLGDDEAMTEEEQQGVEAAYGMVQYKLTMDFEKPIKKSSNDHLIVSPNGRTLSFQGSFLDVAGKSVDLSTKVKF